MPISDLLAASRQVGLVAEPADSVAAACELGIRRAGESGLVVVTGSLYVVGEARSMFVAPRAPNDPDHIAALNGALGIPEFDGRMPRQ